MFHLLLSLVKFNSWILFKNFIVKCFNFKSGVFHFIANYEFVYFEKISIKLKKKTHYFFDDVLQIKLFNIQKWCFFLISKVLVSLYHHDIQTKNDHAEKHTWAFSYVELKMDYRIHVYNRKITCGVNFCYVCQNKKILWIWRLVKKKILSLKRFFFFTAYFYLFMKKHNTKYVFVWMA